MTQGFTSTNSREDMPKKSPVVLGVMQGDYLSPMVFSLTLEEALTKDTDSGNSLAWCDTPLARQVSFGTRLKGTRD